MKKYVSIIGLGYIGLPFALLLNQKGFDVKAIDIDFRKINILKKGKFKSEETKINKMYKSLKKETITFSTKLENSNFYILCLPTPINKKLKCDLSYLVSAINEICKVIKIGETVIIESTVPIGTTFYLKSLIEKKRPDLKNNFNICFIPEKAIPGNTIFEMQNNDRIIGSNEKTFRLVKKIYEKFSKKKIRRYNIEEAEASKLIENSFRDNQLAFANYIDIELKKKKLNTSKIIEICNRHPRVNLLNPSIGVGGHCIPIDPYFLNFEKHNRNMILLSRKINDNKSYYLAQKLRKIIKEEKKNKICLWGLGYKAGSTDIRESPSLKIINLLKTGDFFISDPYFDFLKPKNRYLKNFISPKSAKKKCKFHIILNLEKKYLKKNFSNRKYLLAEKL